MVSRLWWELIGAPRKTCADSLLLGSFSHYGTEVSCLGMGWGVQPCERQGQEVTGIPIHEGVNPQDRQGPEKPKVAPRPTPLGCEG